MAQRKTLTEQQVSILRWIAHGCAEGVMEGSSYRISAAALRHRGLVTTSGRGPAWTAKITDAGREHLREIDGPNPPLPRQANVSVTQQLVDDVIAAGGSLRVPRKGWYDREGVDYANRVRLAERYGKVPSGKRLVVAAIGDALEISLIDGPQSPAPAELLPVVVPARVGRYHAAAQEFRDCAERHEISRRLLSRATRIVHAIAVEAERRGWAVQVPPKSEDGYRRTTWTGAKGGHLAIATRSENFRLRLQEEGVHTRGPWEVEVERYRRVQRESWLYRDRKLPSGPYDADGTGRLKLELFAAAFWIYRGRRSRWADRQTWTLEECLSHLMREIEERTWEAQRVAEEQRIAAEQAAKRAQSEAEERERRWPLLMAQARERYVEANRVAQLWAQADAWYQADQLRRYCDAIDAAHGNHPNTAQWLAWARSYTARLDPLTEPPTMPKPPEPTAEDLQEHLPDGWSAYGPEHGNPRHGA